MMRDRSDPAQKKCIITSLCIVTILLGFLYVYYGSLFSSQSHGASALEYGSRSLRKLGSSCLGEDEDNNKKQDESSTKYGQENGEDDVTLKNFLMEHYERHCLTPERRFNCLIPPPPGYKVPIKWPQNRDGVSKANIPHTHLAHEKSNQN